MKRSEKKKLFTKFSYFEVKASACCLVQRRGVSVRQHSSGNPTTRGVRDALKCDPGKKEVWTPDVDLLSESRVYTRMGGCTHKKIGKPRVTNGSDNSGDLSLRDASLGKPRSMNKRSFTPSNVDSRRKGSGGKGMKGGFLRGTQNNNKESPLCCIDGYPFIQKYMYTPEKCSKEQYYFLPWEIILDLMNLSIKT